MFDRIEQLESGLRSELICSLGSIASAAGGIVSGIMGANAASNAASAQVNSAQNAINTVQGANSTVQTGYQPYQATGTTALNALNSSVANGTGFAAPFSMSNFYSDPGYQFSLQQGQNAINASAAAKGSSLSGGTIKAQTAYATGLANQTYSDAYSRYLQSSQQKYSQLTGLAGLGLNAQNSSASANLSTAGEVGNLYTQQGNAQAAGIIGQQNAINGAISSVTGAANQYSSTNRLSANPISLLGINF